MCHSGLGLVYYDRQKYMEASQEFEEAVKLEGEPDPVDQYLLGNSLIAAKQYSQAITALEACAKPGRANGSRVQEGSRQRQEQSRCAAQAVSTTMVASAQEMLESLLGHRFDRPDWLERALTPQFVDWRRMRRRPGEPEADDNEKLEFLGDAVLALVVSESLLASFPAWREGELSKARATLVNSGALAEAARRLRPWRASPAWGAAKKRPADAKRRHCSRTPMRPWVAALFLDAGASGGAAVYRALLALRGRLRKQAERLGGPTINRICRRLLQAKGWPRGVLSGGERNGPGPP